MFVWGRSGRVSSCSPAKRSLGEVNGKPVLYCCDDKPIVYADVTETKWKVRLRSCMKLHCPLPVSSVNMLKGVALALQARGISVFYDEFEKIALWGKDLGEELQDVYERRSDCVVFFISKAWVEKSWPRHERRASLSRAIQEPREYLLPVRFDDTPVPGLPDSVHYLRAEEYSSVALATVIAQKLGVKPFEGKASDVPPPRMTSLVGEAVFDYSNHNGRYVIGRGTLEFETKWSKASNLSVHVYNDPPSINGLALAPPRVDVHRAGS